MKTVKKNVYYCDFCKKKGLSSGHMKTHELHCTANPKRECRVCHQGAFLEERIVELKTRFWVDTWLGDDIYPKDYFNPIIKWTGNPVTLKEVREMAEGCPMCTLALLRQSGLNIHVYTNLAAYGFGDFDFEKELKEYMNERHREVSYQY